MSGQTYSKMKTDDPCWVIVNDVNSPTGYWRGKVVQVEPQEGWSKVRAVITDPRQNPQHPNFIGTTGSRFYGQEPNANYSVIPSNQEFDGLVRTITHLEATLSNERTTARVREDTLKDAIAYATRLSGDDLKAVLEKKK
ncbi:hypothetical protein ACFL0V_05315 [Nanoarchaeota archaeon]